MQNIYLIKDLAQATGYSVDTLKYYLKIKLITEIGKGIKTGFRFFDDATAQRLKTIRDLRKQGLSIEEIRKTMQLNKT